MQIIAGSARGVRLRTVPDLETRPILDRVKKSLFSMLESAELVAERRVLDLYAGTGVLGLEALSRGASSAVFVERRGEAVALLRENLEQTGLADRAEVRQGDVAHHLADLRAVRALRGSSAASTEAFGLIFYDPPFIFTREAALRPAMETEVRAAGHLLLPGGCLVLRGERRSEPPQPAGLVLARRWTDGPHALCFYFGAPPTR